MPKLGEICQNKFGPSLIKQHQKDCETARIQRLAKHKVNPSTDSTSRSTSGSANKFQFH